MKTAIVLGATGLVGTKLVETSMKTFSFLYFYIFKIIKKEFSNKDTHSTTISDISMPVGVFFGVLTLVVLAESNIWWHIMRIWDPELAKSSKYNPFSPASILGLVMWYLSAKILNWYFKRPEVLEKLRAYYLPYGDDTRTYDTQGRLLIIFFYLAGFFSLILFFTYGIFD
jgi:hypothetical protein